MSENNEEVSGTNSIGGGGGGSSPPTPATNNARGSSTTLSSAGGFGSSIALLGSNQQNQQNHALGSTGFNSTEEGGVDVVKSGYLRKIKGKKKFFVLRRETEAGGPARLEYYVNDRKFRMGQPPKKSIVLKTCFNINRTESKCKFAIALHTHSDCVRVQLNTEEEMNEWLRLMNSLCDGQEQTEEIPSTVPALMKPQHFEHVWIVTALNKGLGSQQGILGSYRLCLTSKELTLLKVAGPEEKNSVLKFPLNVIRNVSHDAACGCFFHIEFGRLACTGAGKLSLKTEDHNISQNMHLFILKAMQNYSKEDLLPLQRPRYDTWTSLSDSPHIRTNSINSTPPRIPRIQSMDGSMRTRTESMSSSSTERRVSGMSPPVAIHSPNSSNAFSNVAVCSTDSASSSYSMDYENNSNSNSGSGGGGGSSHAYSKSQEEDESYVPWDPSGEHAQPGVHNLTLALPAQSDYVETSIGNASGGTPSSNMEMQSPLSPFDNYLAMSPAGAMMGTNGSVKSGGKLSVSHSRNSSLIEDQENYVPMLPPGNHSHSRSGSGACSTAGSTTGLDDAYLDMDFNRKLTLSNDDMRRMSPASSESIQSGTPSSDYQLEKVSSYLQSDDFEDGSIAMRPARAYSVGSRSDTSSTGKNRLGKNRLEAVQETFRTRAMSVGCKQPPRKLVNTSATTAAGLAGSSILIGQSRSGSAAPLSSSWSGSTGRWLPPKIYYHPTGQAVPNPAFTQVQHQAQESGDSDLMELDFSHNKQKSRKRSLPGPGNLSSSSSTGSGAAMKLSPCARAIVGSETPPGVETPDTPRSSSFSANLSGSVSGSPRYATSAPISIQKTNKSLDCGGYMDTSSSILTRMTGLDLNQLKQLDDEGAYLPMDFNPPLNGGPSAIKSYRPTVSTSPLKTTSTILATESKPLREAVKTQNVRSSSDVKTSDASMIINCSTPVVIKANDSVAPAKFTFSSSHHSSNEPPGLSRSLSSSSNISTTSNNSNSSSTSCVSVKSQQQAPLSPERSVPVSLNLPLAATSMSSSSSSSLTSGTGTINSGPGSITPTGTSSSVLSRIEESPEKQGSHLPYVAMQVAAQPPASAHQQSARKGSQEDGQVTYASIRHVNPLRRNNTFPCAISGISIQSPTSPLLAQPSTCSKQSQSSTNACTSKFSPVTSGPANVGGVTYAQLEFLKNTDGVKRN